MCQAVVVLSSSVAEFVPMHIGAHLYSSNSIQQKEPQRHHDTEHHRVGSVLLCVLTVSVVQKKLLVIPFYKKD